MRRMLAAVLAISLITAQVRPAHASHETVGEAVGFFFLFLFDTVVSIGGTVTGIGTSVQLGRERPALGWSIAAVVVGSIAGVLGAVTTGSLIASDVDDGALGIWAFAAVPLALSALNLSVGIVNLARWGSAPPPPRELEEEEYEEEVEERDEWGRGYAPGAVFTFSF